MDIKSRLNLCSPYIAAKEVNLISLNPSCVCGWLRIYGCGNVAKFSSSCSIVFESDLDTETHNIKTNNIGLACHWYIKKDSSTDHLLIGSECSTCSSLSQPNIRLIPGCIYLQITPEVEIDASFANDKMLVTKSYVDTAISGVSGGTEDIPERMSFAVSGSPVNGVVTCTKSFYKSGSSGIEKYPSEAPMVYLTRNSDGAYINADYRYCTSSAATNGGVLEIKINSTSDISGLTAHVFNIVYDAQTAS